MHFLLSLAILLPIWAVVIFALAMYLSFGSRWSPALFESFRQAPLLDVWVAGLTW
ncbi:MAG: hypothetical protein JO353_07615, partial [Phycisphaerae bacterium]|nr:hypothetical protein [Phycisphaerae bacterium]